jgi:hypothetical protein
MYSVDDIDRDHLESNGEGNRKTAVSLCFQLVLLNQKQKRWVNNTHPKQS